MPGSNQQPIYAVTGITGQVGGVVAGKLLEAGKAVRATVRSADKGPPWMKRGCQVAIADMADANALTDAFAGAEGVFILLPPIFAPSPGFPEAKAVIAAVKATLTKTHPKKIVCLSTIGAQATQTSLLTQLSLLEQSLGTLPTPIAFLRAAWFLENFAWDIGPVQKTGVLDSFLQPMEKLFPMVATADVGRVAAELLQQQWTGRRIVELEGPRRITPNDVAATFSKILNRPVQARAIPRETWPARFAAQGPGNFEPRIQMLDGFNQGWITFESDQSRTVKGVVEIESVLRELIQRQPGTQA
jgi:NAD(P)H dehydrogenase (quinone)